MIQFLVDLIMNKTGNFYSNIEMYIRKINLLIKIYHLEIHKTGHQLNHLPIDKLLALIANMIINLFKLLYFSIRSKLIKI